MADRYYSAGLSMVQLFLLDAAGYFAGTRGTAWANAEETDSLVLPGRRSAQFTYSQVNRQPIEEGNKTVGYWEWDGEYINEVSIELSDDDPDLDTFLGATAQAVTNPSSYYQFYTEEEDTANRPLLGAILTQPAQGADGNDGTTFFKHKLILRAKGKVQDGNMEFQGGNANRRLILTPFASLTTPFGITVANLNLSLATEKINTIKFKSNKHVAITGLKHDAILTQYITAYKPDSSSAVAATGANFRTLNGAVTNPTSVTPATGVVVVAAGAAGDKDILMYEHNNAPVA